VFSKNLATSLRLPAKVNNQEIKYEFILDPNTPLERTNSLGFAVMHIVDPNTGKIIPGHSLIRIPDGIREPRYILIEEGKDKVSFIVITAAGYRSGPLGNNVLISGTNLVTNTKGKIDDLSILQIRDYKNNPIKPLINNESKPEEVKPINNPQPMVNVTPGNTDYIYGGKVGVDYAKQLDADGYSYISDEKTVSAFGAKFSFKIRINDGMLDLNSFNLEQANREVFNAASANISYVIDTKSNTIYFRITKIGGDSLIEEYFSAPAGNDKTNSNSTHMTLLKDEDLIKAKNAFDLSEQPTKPIQPIGG
jgi:hypothetical protein